MFCPDADLFFQQPNDWKPKQRKRGTLYLLRRDILTCLGIDPTHGTALKLAAKWPAVMGMFAGIDLMAKFFAGSDTGSVGPRFRTFMGQFFTGLSPADAETIYQLRNAIMHSFGFYSRDKKTGREYRFQLFDGRKSGPLVHHLKAEYYRVDVIAFHDAFERAVNKFATAIDGDSALQSKFTAMFLNYGWMQIG